jgi:hypothetical protein
VTKDTKKLRKACAILRRDCPPLLPVKVRRHKVAADEIANCELVLTNEGNPQYFRIDICPSLPWVAVWLLLLHEWAHTLTWYDGKFVKSHGPEHGMAYSRCYCAYAVPEERI